MRRWTIVATGCLLGVMTLTLLYRDRTRQIATAGRAESGSARVLPYRPPDRSPLQPEGQPVGWVFGRMIGVAPPSPGHEFRPPGRPMQ
jgi:hypothetical protein